MCIEMNQKVTPTGTLRPVSLFTVERDRERPRERQRDQERDRETKRETERPRERAGGRERDRVVVETGGSCAEKIEN